MTIEIVDLPIDSMVDLSIVLWQFTKGYPINIFCFQMPYILSHKKSPISMGHTWVCLKMVSTPKPNG